MFTSLRARLIFLVLIAVIPALAVTLYSGLKQRELAKLNGENDSYRFTRLVANHQASLVEGARQMLLSLSTTTDLTDPAACTQVVEKNKVVYPMYAAISAASPSGQVFCSSSTARPFPSIADRSYFVRAMKTKQFTVGAPVVDRLTAQPVFPLALPVTDSSGNVKMVIMASLEVEQITDFISKLDLPAQSAMLLVDSNGTVIARYPSSNQWAGLQLPNSPVLQKILASQAEGSAEMPGVDGVLRVYTFSPLSTDHLIYISVGIPSEIIYKDANQVLWTSLALMALIALLALAVAWFGGDIFFLRVVSLTAERDQAEQKLRDINANLETLVKQRTEELAKVNDQLSVELVERKHALDLLSRRETELHSLLKALERSNRDLQDFAYIASHDLQEPLRKIQAFGDRLSHRFINELGEDGRDYLNRMNTSASRMQAMVNDLLAYSRVSTKGSEMEQVDLNEVATEVLSDLEVRIHETGAQVTVAPLPTLEADPTQMRQVLQNLIGNAIKFHRPDVPPVVQIYAKTNGYIPVDLDNPAGADPAVTIFVEDNGIGFEEKYLDRIFQPFQRLHSKNEFEGSGIGLSICRKIIERHKGTITAHSEPGSGSCFEIKLPISQRKKEIDL